MLQIIRQMTSQPPVEVSQASTIAKVSSLDMSQSLQGSTAVSDYPGELGCRRSGTWNNLNFISKIQIMEYPTHLTTRPGTAILL